MLVLGKDETSALLQFLNYQDGIGLDLLIDISGLLNGSVIDNLFSQLDRRYSIGQPVVMSGTEIQQHQHQQNRVLRADIRYHIGRDKLCVTQIILLTGSAVSELERIYAHLEDL